MGWPLKEQIGLGSAVTAGYGPTTLVAPPSLQLELFDWIDTGVNQLSRVHNQVYAPLPTCAPYAIPAGSCYFVPVNIQAFWESQIDTSEPTAVCLDVSGILTEV